MGSKFVKCQIETDAGAILNKPLWVPALPSEPVNNRFVSIREGIIVSVYDPTERSSLSLDADAGALEDESDRHWSVNPCPSPPSPAELVPVLPVAVALGLLDAFDNLLGITLV